MTREFCVSISQNNAQPVHGHRKCYGLPPRPCLIGPLFRGEAKRKYRFPSNRQMSQHFSSPFDALPAQYGLTVGCGIQTHPT
ncbi:hypothetical protein TNIN_121711 [Trichonephila inaurata madagascariensis]|uniref:Uncharacterized protein n=1 Tax=Trichonephila inaurata madagascariensis TaxID=2747483 RepID=A0A8X6WUV8_9ARAC|nr:hypothetical protein TNIN_121711 [Trichonephila inaurata madagascariensis]